MQFATGNIPKPRWLASQWKLRWMWLSFSGFRILRHLSLDAILWRKRNFPWILLVEEAANSHAPALLLIPFLLQNSGKSAALWDRHRLASSTVVRKRGCSACSCTCQTEKNPADARTML